MLVPSTLTGRYRKRMTSTAINTESMRSRNHAIVAMTRDRGCSADSCGEALRGEILVPDTRALLSGSLINSEKPPDYKAASQTLWTSGPQFRLVQLTKP